MTNLDFRARRAIVVSVLVVMGLVAAPGTASECGPTAYDCAMYYVGHRQFDSAIRTLNGVLARTPNDLKAINLLGIALTENGQTEEANRQFKKALRLNPRFYPALKNLAANELSLKRTQDAKGHLQEALKYVPDDEMANLMLAEIFYVEKKCAPALEHYNKVRARVVNNTELIFHFSLCALDQGRSDEAATMLDLLPERDAQGHLQAGLMLGQTRSFAEAAKHFGIARKGLSDPYDAGYNQTLMYIRAGDHKAAIQTAAELFTQGFRKAELYSLLSEACLGNEQIKEAYDALRTATQLEPKEEKYYLDLAAICLDYSNYDLGIEICDIGLQNLPDSERLYLQRGVMRAMKGQLAEAEDDFSIAEKLAPQKPLIFVAVGMALMQKGHLQEAVEMLRQKAKEYPNDHIIQWLFGQALVRSGLEPGSALEEEAFSAFETSARLNPDFVYARADLGKLLLKRGETDRGIEELETAMKLDPSQLAPVNQLAIAYRKKGNLAKAKEMTARVAELNVEQKESDTQKQLKRIVRIGTSSFPSREPNP